MYYDFLYVAKNSPARIVSWNPTDKSVKRGDGVNRPVAWRHGGQAAALQLFARQRYLASARYTSQTAGGVRNARARAWSFSLAKVNIAS